MSDDLEINCHMAIADIGQRDWDACACPEAADGSRPVDPFTTYRFLSALEESGSVGAGTGWEPRYLAVRQGIQIIAVAPLYAKWHSQGEYIFDHHWADAFARSGGQYYPKLQISVPFTPATGRRMLVRQGYEDEGSAALLHGALQLARGNRLSSVHITFCTQDEAERLRGGADGLLHRIGQQFHWVNDGYVGFDGFLSSLSSRKRKNIRKERAQAQNFVGKIVQLSGDQIAPEHWDAFWEFYQDTGARKWGQPYLTRQFFEIAHETLRDDILLTLAIREDQPIAGALNFIGRDALFGRYWGCSEHHNCLHFELCYYKAIDYAITHGLARVEAGAQGEHKLARGYLPVKVHSLHWLGDPGFREAVAEYLQAEAQAVGREIEVLTSYGPFKRMDMEEPE